VLEGFTRAEQEDCLHSVMGAAIEIANNVVDRAEQELPIAMSHAISEELIDAASRIDGLFDRLELPGGLTIFKSGAAHHILQNSQCQRQRP
jgi:hypothetical protein